MDTYFTKFPTITYSGVPVRDITRRVVINPETIIDSATYYPYKVESGIRSDVVSHAYYGDQDVDWLIYLANGIVDPYYGWPMSDDQFEEYISSKYGSVQDAKNKIAYWEVNWSEDPFSIPPGRYESMTTKIKGYWKPVLDATRKVSSYKRKEISATTSTNVILTLHMDGSSQTEGVRVLVDSSKNMIGWCEIIYVDSNFVLVKDVRYQGTIDGIAIPGDELNATHVTSNSVVTRPIPLDEVSYWSPVSYYDDELAENEKLKTIMLLDPGQLYSARTAVANKIKE